VSFVGHAEVGEDVGERNDDRNRQQPTQRQEMDRVPEE
jgi:hypothetical protein